MLVSNSQILVISVILFAEQSLVKSYEVPRKEFYDLNLSESIFQNFISEYQKQYTTEEAHYRFQVFKENLKRINELNAKHELTVFGLTAFADLTRDEFMQSMTCLNAVSDVGELIEVSNSTPPETLDYRKQKLVTAVKDQGDCGSCFIFSAIADIEGQYAKKYKKLVQLSEQYPLDCSFIMDCENGGWPQEVLKWLAKKPGALSTEDYPYKAQKNSCAADGKKPVVKVKGGKKVKVADNDGIKQLLYDHGPLSTALFADIDMMIYKAGIFPAYECEGMHPNHAVTIIGYGKDEASGKQYWLIKNSWGLSWGDDGYLLLEMGDCGLNNYLFPSEIV